MDQNAPPSLIFDAVESARRVAQGAACCADAQDHDGGFPAEDIAALARAGLLAAPVPRGDGGYGLGQEPRASELCDVLRLVGSGSLALGRLYEGHVNALHLIAQQGGEAQRATWFAAAREGHLFGVWNTEAPETRLEIEATGHGERLRGGKTFASGAGHVSRALVTARRGEDGRPSMLIVALDRGDRADLSSWRSHGMRASATGTVDLTGLPVAASDILGAPDDYHRQPQFSAGAWRFAAVQTGGIEAILDAWRDHLRSTGRGEDPHQLARLGEGAIAAETARLWVEQAAALATDRPVADDRIVAYVNLARLAVEQAGLDVLRGAQRSVGLQGFLRDHPLERLSRDLATYLRQPAPDRALTMGAREILSAAEPAGDLWRAGETG